MTRLLPNLVLPILALSLGLGGIGTAYGQSALEKEFAEASEDQVAALTTIRNECRSQVRNFWSYAAGQSCKGAVDAWPESTPALTNFVGDLGQASFLVSQTGDACQKDLQQGQDADKEKRYKLDDCPNQEEHMETLRAKLDELDALLATRP